MKLSEAQIQSLLDQHLRQSLNDDEERRVSADRIDRDDLDDELETISFIKSDLREELAVNDYEGISSHVADLLSSLPACRWAIWFLLSFLRFLRLQRLPRVSPY